jgi:glycosyltransferase involved in cell wall biosynthesis
MSPRVCVLTAGHLTTCPRMRKAADALAEAGYRVRVVSTRYLPWAQAPDEALRRSARYAWTQVRYDRLLPKAWSSLRQRGARRLAGLIPPERCPEPLAARAFGRFHSELVRAALAEPADLLYGGTSTGMAATAAAARRAGVPFVLDLEDFHSGEQDDSPAGRFGNALAARIEQGTLHRAAALTAASAAIASAYRERYGVAPVAVNNAFPLPAEAPDLAPSPAPGLRIYWFSQTLGPNRGLEAAVRAIGRAAIPAELHLRGRPWPGYLAELGRLAAERAPRLTLVPLPLIPADALPASCRGFDVGLALEPGRTRNSDLLLSNKALTYVLGGLAVALTDTSGQRPLGRDLGEAALLVPPGDEEQLAAGLARWAEDRPALARARAASWEAARRRWHWEHPEERGALLAAVERALGR